jgi:peptidoglycan/xylan/chitin deacetylase (PgdA/CDA1 family)
MIMALVVRTVLVLVIFGHSIFLMLQGQLLWGILENVLLVGLLLYGTLVPNSRLFGPIRTRTENGPWLTIDDGPDPEDTPAILDLLDEFETKAAFFLIGEKAARHPELVLEIHRRGHAIGNHTWSHPQASFWAAGPRRTWREIDKCQGCLTELLGEAPRLFRAPVGHSNLFVHPVLKILGLNLVGWSARGYDTVATDPAPVLKKIEKSLSEEAIVLVHEGTPIARELIRDVLVKLKAVTY